MQGRSRKAEATYYTCGYRTSYGDRAAEAVGHGKWQYVREDSLTTLIDSFFATRIFGADRLAHFRTQSSTLASELHSSNDDQRTRIAKQVGEVDQRIERQLAAIEAGVDPVLVGERIRNLKAEREEAQAALAQLEASYRDSTAVDPPPTA
jgi:chromosome segregation ATPase